MRQRRDNNNESPEEIGWVLIPPSILSAEDLNMGQKVVWGRVNGLIAKRGYCYASNAWLGKQLGYSERTIEDYVCILVEKEYLIRKYGPGGKRERRLYPVIPVRAGKASRSEQGTNKSSTDKSSNTEEKDTSPNGDAAEAATEDFKPPETPAEYTKAVLYHLTHHLKWFDYVEERHGAKKGWLRGIFACGIRGFPGEDPPTQEECENLYQAVLATKEFPRPPKKQKSAGGFYRELIRRCRAGKMTALDGSWAA